MSCIMWVWKINNLTEKSHQQPCLVAQSSGDHLRPACFRLHFLSPLAPPWCKQASLLIAQIISVNYCNTKLTSVLGCEDARITTRSSVYPRTPPRRNWRNRTESWRCNSTRIRTRLQARARHSRLLATHMRYICCTSKIKGGTRDWSGRTNRDLWGNSWVDLNFRLWLNE